jgi:hypothetical protein
VAILLCVIKTLEKKKKLNFDRQWEGKRHQLRCETLQKYYGRYEIYSFHHRRIRQFQPVDRRNENREVRFEMRVKC